MKRYWILGLAFVIALLWTAGGVAAAPKGKVVIGLAGEPTTFDPHRITGLPLHMHYPLVFDQLVFFDHSGKLTPKFAKSYRMLKPTLWEFKLLEGVKFSNGEPADAHAVKYSIERIKNPKLKSRQVVRFRDVTRVEVVDRYTVRFHTKKLNTFMIPPLAMLGHIVPPKYYKSHDLKYLARHPVGSGPYKLVRWKKGQEFVYEANPGYRDPNMPPIKTGVVKIIPEPTTRIAALMAGDVEVVNAVPPQMIPFLKKNPNIEVISGRSPRTCRVLLVTKPGASWTDVRVRKALNHALDKHSIIKNVLEGHAKIIAANLGPTSFGHNFDLKPYPFDPARARKLLAEAGYPKGFGVELFVPLGRYLKGKQVSEAIAGQMEKVGLKVNVRTVEWGYLSKHFKARWKSKVKPFWFYSCRMDLYLHAQGMYGQEIYSKGRWSGFRDKGLDKLLDEARLEADYAKREQKYRELSRIIHGEKVPMIFLYQQDQINAKNKRIDWKLRPNATVLLSDMSFKN
ncbi:ABC transporter substrate-binding protein [Nitrospinota bacterium]